MTEEAMLQALRALLDTDPRTLDNDLLWRLEANCHLAGERLRHEMYDRAKHRRPAQPSDEDNDDNH